VEICQDGGIRIVRQSEMMPRIASDSAPRDIIKVEKIDVVLEER
jgi:hypothetical protein